MNRNVGDVVLINPYSKVTGEIICRNDLSNGDCGNFDYKVKLNIPQESNDTIYTFNYDSEKGYWWQFFNDDELDVLERNYESVTKSR